MILNTGRRSCGVQLAIDFPPGRQTRTSSLAAFCWFGVNITPKVESTTSKLASPKGRFSAVVLEGDRQTIGRGAFASALEQRGDVVGRQPVGERRAAASGYGSEAAFSRAFKKMVGVPPSSWRRRAPEPAGGAGSLPD